MAPLWNRWSKGIAKVAGGAAVALGLIAFAHTSAGRPLLRVLSLGGKCPLGLDAKLTPAQRDAARRNALVRVRGLERAAHRPALGFALEKTTRGDVDAWAQKTGQSCVSSRFGGLDCKGVAATSLPDPASTDFDAVHFTFDASTHLVCLDASTKKLDPAHAAAEVDAAAQRVAGEVGHPSTSLGSTTVEHLLAAPITQVGSSFAFVDYCAEVTATRMGGLGLLVRETYESIPD